jgi:hypothetical protein
MQKLKYFVLGLLVVVVLAYGGIKTYMYYSLKSKMDQLAQQFSLFGQLKYGGLTTSVKGSLAVEDLSIRVHGMDDELRIKAIRYQTPNLLYLVQANKQFEQGRIPESLSLSVEGLNVELYGEFTERLEQIINELNFQLHGVNPLCGGRLFFGPRELRDMGYEEITGDIQIGYRFDAANARIIVDITSRTRDMMAARMQGIVEGISDTSFISMMQPTNPPRLSKITVNYTDQSYTKRFTEYCAGLSKLELNEYIAAEANQQPIYYSYAWGFVPGPGLRQAYRAFLTNPGQIDISLELPDSVTPENIDLFSPEDIPGLLNLKVSVNGEVVNDLSFNIYKGQKLDMGGKIEQLFAQPGAEPVSPQPKKKKVKYETKYYRVPVSGLKKYLGEEVRLQTTSGKTRLGFLAKIGTNVAHVEQRVHGGKFTMQVPLGDVTKAEVLLTRPVK